MVSVRVFAGLIESSRKLVANSLLQGDVGRVLQSNSITGTIPTEIGELADLQTLYDCTL